MGFNSAFKGLNEQIYNTFRMYAESHY